MILMQRTLAVWEEYFSVYPDVFLMFEENGDFFFQIQMHSKQTKNQ